MVSVDRFEYAWRWFSLHAAQRYSVFNFFMVFSAVLANAFVLLMNNGNHAEAGFLALLAMVASGLFVFLDSRNRQLVHFGELLLGQIERGEDGFGQTWQGPITLDTANEQPFFRKHWFLITGIESFAVSGFGVAAIWAFNA